MNLKDAGKHLLGSLAPLVGTAIGGPFGGIAGKLLADKLGVDQKDVADILQQPTTEQVALIKQAESDFEKFMRDAEIREEELHQRDRDSARSLAKSTSLVPQIGLSVLYTVGYFVILIGMLTGLLTVPEGNELIAGLVGVLTAGQVKIMDFFLGSSAGSKMKYSHPAHYSEK